jgi:hypothetical protein
MVELFLVAALWVAAFALIFIAQGLAVIARILRDILEQLRRR